MALHRDIHWGGGQWAVTAYGVQARDRKHRTAGAKISDAVYRQREIRAALARSAEAVRELGGLPPRR
jgi:hypothetical protein